MSSSVRGLVATRPNAYWDSIADEERTLGRSALWRRHCDAVNADLLERWLPGTYGPALKTDLFDEAQGRGLLPLISSRSSEVVGVDVSETAVRAARVRHSELDAVQADVRFLPFEQESFEVIVSNSTLDHFSARSEILLALRELRRVLQRDGLLIVTLDNWANPVVAIRNAMPHPFVRRIGLVPYYVGPTYGPRGLRRALEREGFRVREMTAVLHCPRALSLRQAERLDREGSPQSQREFLQRIGSFERLERLPTRFRSGYFVAALAEAS
jgi:SAM-dependent methyltransferase